MNPTVADTVTAAEATNQVAIVLFGMALEHWIFFGSMLGTFSASVMAHEQTARIKNGAFGTIAGTAAGGIGAIIGQQNSLLLLGFFGSSIGAATGWLVSILLSYWASKSSRGKSVLAYMVGGFEAVKGEIDSTQDNELLLALQRWSGHFVRSVTDQTYRVARLPKSGTTNVAIELLIRQWLASVVNVLDLLFPLAKRPQYRSRVTIIVFGKERGTNDVCGKHWLFDSGHLGAHKTQRGFDNTSIGYKVLIGKLSSPFYAKADQPEAQARGEQPYRPFITFRITDNVVLSLDWHEDLPVNDIFVQQTRSLFLGELCPEIKKSLDQWHGELADNVGLEPL